MEVELAEQKLKTMEHSEQHYFKRYVCEPWRRKRRRKLQSSSGSLLS